MKKFLLLVLSLSVLAVLSACSDSGSSSNNGGGTTGPTFTADDLVGTYKVVSFKTTTNYAGSTAVSDDCSSITGKGICDQVTMYGANFTITKSGDNLVAESQMQMYGTIMGNASPEDTYQYTKYSNMAVSDFPRTGTTKIYTGVSGRNLKSLTDNPDAAFSFTMNADGTITNNLSIIKTIGDQDVTANTVVVLRKTSPTVTTTITPDELIVPAESIENTTAQGIFNTFVPALIAPTAN